MSSNHGFSVGLPFLRRKTNLLHRQKTQYVRARWHHKTNVHHKLNVTKHIMQVWLAIWHIQRGTLTFHKRTKTSDSSIMTSNEDSRTLGAAEYMSGQIWGHIAAASQGAFQSKSYTGNLQMFNSSINQWTAEASCNNWIIWAPTAYKWRAFNEFALIVHCVNVKGFLASHLTASRLAHICS